MKNNEFAVLQLWKLRRVKEVRLSGTSFGAKFDLTTYVYSGVQSSAIHAPACFPDSINFLSNN